MARNVVIREGKTRKDVLLSFPSRRHLRRYVAVGKVAAERGCGRHAGKQGKKFGSGVSEPALVGRPWIIGQQSESPPVNKEAVFMPKVVSNLWFAEEAREAVEFYVSVIPDSRIGRTTILPAETPSGPPGSVELIEFTLAGQAFLAMKAGPLDSFNHSFSIAILVESQAEIDRIWEAFLANGGTPEACGWLKDRWGLSWQIVPRVLSEMIADSDRERARRVTEVMLGMVKIDVAALQDAFNG
jgi:predicted 3-demethylubiquinone-9 3-methyltransferase (glyoxalase superfamily)